MTSAASLDAALRENSFLRARNDQLQDDVTSLSAEVARLRQILERVYSRSNSSPPNPLGGGQ